MKRLHKNSLIKKISLTLLTLSITLGGVMSLNAAWPDKKIGGGFAFRVQEKQVASQKKSVTEKQAYLTQKGIVTKSVTTESAVLYVENELTDDEKAAMAKRGIKVNPSVYIPAVGKHPYGFHLAEVPINTVDYLESVANVVYVDTAEGQSTPKNNLGRAMIKTDLVQAGTGVNSAYTGAGVKIAIADSGFDLTHADFPTPIEAYDMTDGTGTGDWGTSVANTVSSHGTHVAGSAIGSGSLSSGTYKGGAPGADVYLYKIGSDATSSAQEVDEIEAVARAVAVGCDIFSMSYGGYSYWMDGSSALSQAIDSAVTTSNMMVFISAGNEGAANRHFSANLAPGATTPTISFTIDNSGSGVAQTATHYINIVWDDGSSGDYNMTMACSNLGAGEAIASAFTGTSSRGTESNIFGLTPNIAAAGSKTYTLSVNNSAGSGATPMIHLYSMSSGYATFAGASSSYTVSHPALADEAIAVGAWTQRTGWTNYLGSGYSYPSATYNTLASFSSRGPRIDGTMKPEMVAPGYATISCRDSVVSPSAPYIIDNDGLTLNGSGPANYFVTQGTSMACPLAAGSAALLVEAVNAGSPTAADLRSILLNTADNTVTKAVDNQSGHGLINIQAAVQDVESTYPVELDYFMIE